MSERSDKPLILVPGPMPGASGTMTEPERRLDIRYPFTAAAEIVEVFSQTRVTGRTSDLGRGGCYIDTLSPLAVGAVVRVRLERELRVFQAVATVIYAHLSMGMGLAFTEIKPEHRAVLDSWMAELSGERMPKTDAPATAPGAAAPSPLLTMQQVLNDLVNLMVRKRVINENEGATLLRRLSR